jgi:hypothetical protein
MLAHKDTRTHTKEISAKLYNYYTNNKVNIQTLINYATIIRILQLISKRSTLQITQLLFLCPEF